MFMTIYTYLYSNNKRNILCRFIATGQECKFGENCLYLHDENLIKVCPLYLSNRLCVNPICKYEHDTKNSPTCIHYIKGRCIRNNCKFKHPFATDNSDNDCLVCLNNIEYGKRYALLPCCNICICVDCVLKNKRKCPVCKEQTKYVVESFKLLKGREKMLFIDKFLKKTQNIYCKYGNRCKYKNCIYKH